MARKCKDLFSGEEKRVVSEIAQRLSTRESRLLNNCAILFTGTQLGHSTVSTSHSPKPNSCITL